MWRELSRAKGREKERDREKKNTPPFSREKKRVLLLLFSRFFSARGENRARNRVAKNPRATRCPNRTENASLRSFRPFSAKKTGRELGRFRCFHHRRRRSTRLPERQKYAKRRRRRKARAEKTNEKHSRDGNFLGLLGLDRGGLFRDSLGALSSGHFGCFRFGRG